MAPLPEDYLERVYAGVLGKLIGVYLGRPIEGWSRKRILKELGHIRYYVNEQLGVPLVVVDDDISGTFTFVQALEEHAKTGSISAEDVGKTWLNNVINRRAVFFWGGNGIMTEHTAYLNLKNGIAAPRSGSIEMNGKQIAEQIGAQIFIDGFALASPGNPAQSVRLAEAAASVSHDGAAVHAAKVWAAMEAEAFVSKDVEHLLNTALRFIPSESIIATLIADVRRWSMSDRNWETTRQRIEDQYGYDRYGGLCHVVPNHAILIMALMYASDDFDEAMHIINTCAWDTDSNSGILGCLIAIMHGLAAFDGGQDWRGPVADRVLISSANGGYSINNAARLAYDITNMGRKLTGERPLIPPKDGAQYHFTLPGSVQGFKMTSQSSLDAKRVLVEQGIDAHTNTPGLAIRISQFNNSMSPIEITTPTFAPEEVREMKLYDFVGSPLLYTGQTIRAVLHTDPTNTCSASVRLVIKAYTFADDLETFVHDLVALMPGCSGVLEWTIPTTLGGRPIQSVGIVVSSSAPNQDFVGTVWLDRLGWTGTPTLMLNGAEEGSKYFYTRSFVNGADFFFAYGKFRVAQDHDEGIVTYGTREFRDYKVVFRGFTVNLGAPSGVAIRVQGLNRYYGLLFVRNDRVSLIKALDEQRIELASTRFCWKFDVNYQITMEVQGDRIYARVGDTDTELSANDSEFLGGGVGLVATGGSISVDTVELSPLK